MDDASIHRGVHVFWIYVDWQDFNAYLNQWHSDTLKSS